jgi:hypothetical protein
MISPSRRTLATVMFLLLNTFLVSATHANGVAAPSTRVVTDLSPSERSKQADLDRALYVRSMLLQRINYVNSGERMADFSRFVKEQGGHTVMHRHSQTNGHDVSNDPEQQQHALSASDPFSKDRLNLDLVDDESPDCPKSRFRGQQLFRNETYNPNLLQLTLRAIHLFILFSPLISTLGIAMMSTTFRQGTWYRLLTACIASAGAAWIKWGQWSSTRRDMFPDALCDNLSKLHSDAPAHSAAYSRDILERSLGLARGKLHHVFDEFDGTPIASGSIAQIHKACINGHLVAVKIRHPNVAKLMDMDFRLMSLAARCLDWIPALSWLHIRDSVEQFSYTMAAQSYLNVEAHHLEVLNQNFENWSHVRFPQPFYASSAVIIETFEPGRIVTSVIAKYEQLAEKIRESPSSYVLQDVEELEQRAVSVIEKDDENEVFEVTASDLIPIDLANFIVSTGLGLYLKMLLVDGLMHADLHP